MIKNTSKILLVFCALSIGIAPLTLANREGFAHYLLNLIKRDITEQQREEIGKMLTQLSKIDKDGYIKLREQTIELNKEIQARKNASPVESLEEEKKLEELTSFVRLQEESNNLEIHLPFLSDVLLAEINPLVDESQATILLVALEENPSTNQQLDTLAFTGEFQNFEDLTESLLRVIPTEQKRTVEEKRANASVTVMTLDGEIDLSTLSTLRDIKTLMYACLDYAKTSNLNWKEKRTFSFIQSLKILDYFTYTKPLEPQDSFCPNYLNQVKRDMLEALNNMHSPTIDHFIQLHLYLKFNDEPSLESFLNDLNLKKAYKAAMEFLSSN